LQDQTFASLVKVARAACRAAMMIGSSTEPRQRARTPPTAATDDVAQAQISLILTIRSSGEGEKGVLFVRISGERRRADVTVFRVDWLPA
jgi:hypothetical protein